MYMCLSDICLCCSIATLSIGLVDFAFAIYSRYSDSGSSSNGNDIGYSAHIGGAVAGFLVGMNILRNFYHKVNSSSVH